MVHLHPPENISKRNEESLNTLVRAIQLSQGQFSMVLASCNYAALRHRMLQRLRELLSSHDYQIRELVLPQTVLTLYTTIQLQLSSEQPSALMVLGLEFAGALDDLLVATNQVRDEFRKRLPFPIVLWVNDDVLQKLVRLAPDFTSWAATPIKFEMATDELINFLQQETSSLFATALDASAARGVACDGIYPNGTFGQVRLQHRYELNSAIKELQSRGIKLKPELDASLQFVFGLDEYVSDRIDSALAHLLQSLRFWQQETGELVLETDESSPHPLASNSYIERQGVLLFHIGLCYCRQADRYRVESYRYWQEARHHLEQCVELFEQIGRQDLVAQFIDQLGEVLHNLNEWQALQILAEASLTLHRIYGNHLQLAQDYGFLAEVALQQSRWREARLSVQAALSYIRKVVENQHQYQCLFPLLLAQRYRLLLAKAQRHLGQEQAAVDNLDKASKELEDAIAASDHRYDAYRYIRSLRALRSLYFEQGRYLEAFRIKQRRRSVEQQYGFRAFIGAGRLQAQRQPTYPGLVTVPQQGTIALEIAASGRQRDINHLIGRISRPDQKLTVIHGQSGVGKSSTVTAGLVPALRHTALGDQIAVPVVLQVYNDWVRELGKSLAEALGQVREDPFDTQAAPYPATFNSVEAIQKQLQANASNHLITVLIFDQFEEFFFGSSNGEKTQQFDKFIRDCLNIAFVKVILSLREDYLYRLLEFKHLANLEVIDSNILDKSIRHQLNNFPLEDARSVIQRLTERSHFHLEPELIDALVKDLSAELGEVRPIELQVVGAQLQDERITKLVQYQQVGSKKLIERYLKEVITDCGHKNERAAQLVLYLLTDENHNRPFKTRAELAGELTELGEVDKLDLVLEILVRSGLVVQFPDVPDRYQLIHDYLVELIRYLQQKELGLEEQLKELRNKEEQSRAEIKRLRAELEQKQQQVALVESGPQPGLDLLTELKALRKNEELSRVEIERLQAELKQKGLQAELTESKEKQRLSEARLNRFLKIALASSVTAICVLTFSTVIAVFERRQAVISEMQAVSASSEELFASDKQIDALKEGLKAGINLKRSAWTDSQIQAQVLTALYQAVYGVRERNRFDGHTAGVNSVSFSPDGSLIASASADNTIKLWGADGTLRSTLEGHRDAVNSVSFSPDSRTIASASADGTIKLWSLDGRPKTLEGHRDAVNWVSFSPDGQTLASASADSTIKLWSKGGNLIKTLKGHSDAVLGVSFSPDGSSIASASADSTIKLWSQDGRQLRTLKEHSDAVLGVSFSPDGSSIASASFDKKIKLWSVKGNSVKTLVGHTGGVTAVSFSPDGSSVASASTDDTIKLWSHNGQLLGTLRRHSKSVNSISFSPDGRTIASASLDKTIKLWRWHDMLVRSPNSHQNWVTSISFSPQGELIASASQDKTVKLWSRYGGWLRTLKGHKNEVWGVSFSPDGQTIASASKDQTVRLWSLDGTLLHTLKGHDHEVLGVSFSPDGQMVASVSKDQTVKLWSKDGRLLNTLQGHRGAVNWVSFSPDGQLIVSASDDRTMKLWHPDGTLLQTLKGHQKAVWGVSFSHNGQIIASASIDNTIKLWSRDGELLRTIEGDGDWFTSVSFSRDDKILAATSDDKVKLWYLDGRLLVTLKGNGGNKLSSVSFSPDAKILVAGSANGTVILWNLADIKLENLLVRGCGWLYDYLKHNSKVMERDRALCDEIT